MDSPPSLTNCWHLRGAVPQVPARWLEPSMWRFKALNLMALSPNAHGNPCEKLPGSLRQAPGNKLQHKLDSRMNSPPCTVGSTAPLLKLHNQGNKKATFRPRTAQPGLVARRAWLPTNALGRKGQRQTASTSRPARLPILGAIAVPELTPALCPHSILGPLNITLVKQFLAF